MVKIQQNQRKYGEWFDEMQWVYNSMQLFIIKNVIQWLKRYWTFRY